MLESARRHQREVQGVLAKLLVPTMYHCRVEIGGNSVGPPTEGNRWLDLSVTPDAALGDLLEQLPPLLKDCLHTYRSVLDHVVYGLAEAEFGRQPDDQDPEFGRVAFTVMKSAADFPQRLKSRSLKKLCQETYDFVLSQQSFNTTPDFPGQPPILPSLVDLDDITKHRRLRAALAIPRGVNLRIPRSADMTEMRMGFVRMVPGEEARVGSAQLDRDARGLRVSLTPTIDVMIDAPTMQHWPIRIYLWAVDARVSDVLSDADRLVKNLRRHGIAV